jgi:uncharacterized protein (DUF1330 family)
MLVFLLIETQKILNPEMYEEYSKKAKPIIINYGGEYVIKSEKLSPLAGDWDIKRIIMIRFPSLDDLQSCFDSVEYREIAHLREHSVLGKAIVIT